MVHSALRNFRALCIFQNLKEHLFLNHFYLRTTTQLQKLFTTNLFVFERRCRYIYCLPISYFYFCIYFHFTPRFLHRSAFSSPRFMISTHFKWKKCPTALHGQHKGRKESKSLVLEAVVDCDLRFWHINFGRPGSLNDLNILNQSSIVRKLLCHDFKIETKPYTINHTVRDYMYFLVDGIYPPWSIFAPTIKNPRNIKEKIFSKQQE